MLKEWITQGLIVSIKNRNRRPVTMDISCFCCFIVWGTVGAVDWNMFLGLAEFQVRHS